MAKNHFALTRWCILFLTSATSFALHAAIPDAERQVLLNLYADTNGKGWITHTNWNAAAGTECSWFGITCDEAQSHVTEINLPVNHLAGTLPALAPLTNLQNVDVDTNALTGSIPPLASIASFSNLFAYDNQLSGQVPALAGLTQLSYFYVYNNNLTGTIPDLTNLPTLCHFNLSNNALSGSIPTLTQLSNLVVFNVASNNLTGSVPALTGLTNLSLFNVGHNKLTGSVPAVPSPDNLQSGGSGLCPNPLTIASDTNWNAATGYSQWWQDPNSSNRCDEVFINNFDK